MHSLKLRIENHATLPNGGPVTLTLSGGSAQVGRKAGMDWVLPDASRHISGHHFDVSFRDGRYYITDVSANGTFLHGERYRLDSAHEVQDGDRYTVGHYIIRATLEAGATEGVHDGLQTPMATAASPAPVPGVSVPPYQADLDDWADLMPQTPAHHTSAAQPPLQTPGHMPDQAPPTPDMGFVPPMTPPPPMQYGGPAVPPAGPSAWDMPAAPEPYAPPHPGFAPEPPAPATPPEPQPFYGQPAAPLAPEPPSHPQGSTDTQDRFLTAFLEGAGVSPHAVPDIPPEVLGRMLGQCVRMCTDDFMKMLTDRSAVKMFFSKEERTMLNASGNNPMKFMPDRDMAFAAMFLTPRDGYMTGPDSFANALTDIRQHQAAVVAALQPALAEMLDGLSPDEIETTTEGGRLSGKSKKFWEEFVRRWDDKAAKGENGMLDAFIEAFSRHYADALRRM
ncbi:MAG: type VI secretion system-associated FHA domain protein TagH [Rhodobacteraceae bacterium]|nr:MAG: type VI secretion system-associated FHA domain protein TagH [Paracoccaceae bacterium]